MKFDTLTAVMVIVVTTVSAMVHVYSIVVAERAGRPEEPRFMAYLSLFFTFAMLALAPADNLAICCFLLKVGASLRIC